MRDYQPYDINKLDEVVVFKGNDTNHIEMVREKNYLYLYKKEDESKYYRYNLNTSQFERINIYKNKDDKITPVLTHNITGWFTNCTLYTKDVHFGRLMVFAKSHAAFTKYRSPVRFIEALGSPIIKNLEQWESFGVILFDVEDMFGRRLNMWGKDKRKGIYFDEYSLPRHEITLSKGPSECTKNFLEYVKKYVMDMDLRYKDFEHILDRYSNGEFRILQELIELNNSDEFYRIFCEGGFCFLTGKSYNSLRIREDILTAITTYHLDPVAFCRFIKRQKNVEKNDVHYLFRHHHYLDYLEAEYYTNNCVYSKMDKYPKNFRTAFHQVTVEYGAIKSKFDEQKFQKVCEDNSNLAYNDKKYAMVLPKHSDDIVKEAQELHHCVRSYIPQVVKNKTLIMFLRDKEDIDTPLVTVEVRRKSVRQAYGINDSKPLPEHLKFLRQWAKKNNLKMACWNH